MPPQIGTAAQAQGLASHGIFANNFTSSVTAAAASSAFFGPGIVTGTTNFSSFSSSSSSSSVTTASANSLITNLSTASGRNTLLDTQHQQEQFQQQQQSEAAIFNDNFMAPFIDDCAFHATAENYFMIATFSIIFCLSVIGNSIVVVVIMQQRSMRSVTNLYLLNLALTDLLLSVVCMPPTLVSSLVYCWVFGDLLCKLLAYLQPVVVTASAYTLAAIALERYYAICRPLHSRVWHTRTHAMFMISLVWLVSVISNVFMLFMYEQRSYNHNGLNCSPKFEPMVHFGYQIYMTVVLLIIPLVTMTLLYCNVIRTLSTGIRIDIAAIEVAEAQNGGTAAPLVGEEQLRRQKSASLNGSCNQNEQQQNGSNRNRFSSWALLRKEISNGSDAWKLASSSTTATMGAEQSLRSTHSSRTALAKQRLIRMLIVIVVIFFCCWTPSYIWWLLLNAQDLFGTFNIWNSELNTLITVLTYLSSCTNPITYCFLNNKFRNALFLTFGCRTSTGSDRSRLHRAAVYHQQQHERVSEMPSCDPNNNNNKYNNNAHKGVCKSESKNDENCCIQHMMRCTKRAVINSSHSGSLRRMTSARRRQLQKLSSLADKLERMEKEDDQSELKMPLRSEQQN